jgi:hypothetical protein
MKAISGMFSKGAPGGAGMSLKLLPGQAMPHCTLPTTEGGRIEIGKEWLLLVVVVMVVWRWRWIILN